MYKVTKAFIYRAKLYVVGQELPDEKYKRMARDKVAAKRGILEMVAPQEPPEVVVEPVAIVSHETKPKKQGRPKKQIQE